MTTLSESLEGTVRHVALYFNADEELAAEKLQSLEQSLADDVLAEVDGKQKDFHEFLSRLDTILDLYQEGAELYPRLHATLHEAMKTLPAAMNAKHTASHNLLATTIETTLLKLSLVRARLENAIYNYASPSTQGVRVSQAVVRLHEKLVARERALETQERDIRSRLKEYEQLLELVDGTGGGFGQVVKDLATVKREAEECRKDLRRLGWTEN
ncbi:hypothetical protein JB92DRAFT_1853979 [Gautieria morchelliformis]|nr:hypothetical protein JB92DRAFT_1853979 [Gautieria morchelliformis]